MATSLLRCERISKGKPATKCIGLTYQDTGKGLPLLMLTSGHDLDSYRVEEVTCGMDGRGFILHRSEQSKAADGSEADEWYGVFVSKDGPEQDMCECKGAARFGYCKHQTAMRHVIEHGWADEFCADRKPDVFPSPQQLADDAGVALPF